MVRSRKLLILLISLWGARATPRDPLPRFPDEDLVKLSQGEAIEIFDERPDKPFDRDTEVRLTGEQLAARGAVDLGTALALLPDVIVRDAGRGGFNVDIRGARKGAVACSSTVCSSPIRTTAHSTSRRSRSPTSCRSGSRPRRNRRSTGPAAPAA